MVSKKDLETPPKSQEEIEADQTQKELGVVETVCAVLSAKCPDEPPPCKDMQDQLIMLQKVFADRAKKKLKKDEI